MKVLLPPLVAIALAMLASLAQGANSANSLFVIKPYFKDGTWVFDDERRKLVEEPFVAGVPEIITTLVEKIPNAKTGFRLTFSASPFPGYQLQVIRGESESGGFWYKVKNSEEKGWLCPALFKYYEEAPEALYLRADPIENERNH